MKHKLALLLFSLGFINSAFATNDTFQNQSNLAVSCLALTNGDRGSAFESFDKSMDAKLYYKAPSDGVSGGFGAMVDGRHQDAPLIDSHCNGSVVTINWSSRTFSGHLVGRLTSTGIVDVTGQINDTPVSGAVLLYKGHA